MQKIQEASHKLSLWFRLAPLWLIIALAILCLKSAPAQWPLVLLSLMGYVCISLWEKIGLMLSFAALVWVACSAGSFFSDLAWSALFLSTMTLSWVLLYFQEKVSRLCFTVFESQVSSLKQQLRLFEELLQQEKKGKEQASQILQQNQIESALMLQQVRQENAGLMRTLEINRESLSEEIPKASSVEDAGQLEQLQQQYHALKMHFEEKASALEVAKKELFKIQGTLHGLEGEQKEAGLQTPEEVALLSKELIQLEEECQALEQHIASLYEFITLLVPFAKTKLKIPGS